MSTIFSGFRILFVNMIPVALLLVCCLGLGIIFLGLIPSLKRIALHQKAIISLVPGSILLMGLSFLLIQLAKAWQPAFIIGSRLCLAVGLISTCVFLLSVWKQKFSKTTGLIVSLAFLSFLIFLGLRLAFISELVLPPYHDSVAHYRILLSFLDPQITPFFLSGGYYHYGFHSIAAWLVEVSGVAPEQALPLLGQFFLSLVPLSLYSFVFSISKNWKTSLLTALVGTFFWAMPVHAANWGKYPALAAGTLLPGLAAVLVLLWQDKSSKKWWLHLSLVGVFLLIGIFFLHSRGGICFALAILFLLADTLFVCRLSHKMLRISAAFVAALFLASVVFSQSILWLYATPVLPFVFFVLGCIAVVIWQPRVMIGVSLWTLTLLALTQIPAIGYFARFSLTLIDTPFYQLVVFLPITLITGIGLSSMLERVSVKRWLKIIALIGLAALLIFTVFNQAYLPDDCCNYTSSADLDVMKWMKANLPSDAAVAIPGRFDLYPVIGADSGIWITQLTGRDTFMLPYDFAWFEKSQHDNICDLGVVYIFASDFTLSFQINAVTHPDWYQPIIQTGDTTLYRVIGCNE